jgi:hypothetical protein
MSASILCLDFETFHGRHGEAALQALIENWEHHLGVPSSIDLSLDQRWARLIDATDLLPPARAA